MVIASHFGNETNNWSGKQIELYIEKVPFQGMIVDAIRVRLPSAPIQDEPSVTQQTPVEDAVW